MSDWVDEDLDDTLKLNLDDIKRAPVNLPVRHGEVLLDEIALQDKLDRTREKLQAALTRHSDLSASVEEIKEENRELRRKDETSTILNALIEPMANKSYRFMCVYCASVGLIVISHGLPSVPFKLDESTMNFLVGSTAVTVIGLVGMVLTGVFLNARK